MNTTCVQVILSDPWDLGESLQWRPLSGVLAKVDLQAQEGGRALIKFDQPILYRGISYQFAVAAPRHEGSHLEVLYECREVNCGFTAVSDEHASSEKALSTDHWRGGLAFIGTIKTSDVC